MNTNESINYLEDRLIKECTNSREYLGVEIGHIEYHPEYSYIETFFDRILREMNTLSGNADEYVWQKWEAWEDSEEPFKTYRNAQQHINRLGRFVHKYVDDYLTMERAEAFKDETKQYMT